MKAAQSAAFILSGEKQSPIAVTIENIPNYEVFQRANDLE